MGVAIRLFSVVQRVRCCTTEISQKFIMLLFAKFRCTYVCTPYMHICLYVCDKVSHFRLFKRQLMEFNKTIKEGLSSGGTEHFILWQLVRFKAREIPLVARKTLY